MQKRCFKCRKIKDLDDFYQHKEMADGHLGKCKTCTKKDVKRRYYDPDARERIARYEKERAQKPDRKQAVIEYQRRRRKKYPGKNRARNKISNAIRDGKLVRKPCQICGDTNSEAHHTDYRKPLDV